MYEKKKSWKLFYTRRISQLSTTGFFSLFSLANEWMSKWSKVREKQQNAVDVVIIIVGLSFRVLYLYGMQCIVE